MDLSLGILDPIILDLSLLFKGDVFYIVRNDLISFNENFYVVVIFSTILY